MPTNHPISEQMEPVVDLKYLQKKPRDPAGMANQGGNDMENAQTVAGMPNKRTVRPFPVSAANQMRGGNIQNNS